MTFVRRNAIALLALFVALGGSSYAAIKLPAKSVGERELKTGAVSSRVLSDGIEKQLGAAGTAGRNGAPGTQGPKGDTGPAGPQGPPGTTNRPIVREAVVNAQGYALAECLWRDGEGLEYATGGGYSQQSGTPTESGPVTVGTYARALEPVAWRVHGATPGTWAYVICVKP